jgi:VanZ family protein
MSGFLIFLYSVTLETAQFFLPYRTFNMDDIAANASGIFLFVVIWIIYFQVLKSKQEG